MGGGLGSFFALHLGQPVEVRNARYSSSLPTNPPQHLFLQSSAEKRQTFLNLHVTGRLTFEKYIRGLSV